MSPREEKNKGDNTNMLNNKGFFPYFLIQNTSKGYTYLKQSSGADSSPGNPSIGTRQEFVAAVVYANANRPGYVNVGNEESH